MGNPEAEKLKAASEEAPVNRYDHDDDEADIDESESLPAYNKHADSPRPPPATPSPSTSATQLNEHVFDLRDEKTGRPWALMKVKSLARSLTSNPIFGAGEDIVGSVELDLKDSTTFHSVSIRVSTPLSLCLIRRGF